MEEDSSRAARPTPKRDAGGAFGLWIAPLIGVVVVLGTCGREACNYIHDTPILRDGTPAKAKVLRLEPTGSSMNDDLKVRIDLDVQPVGQAAYEAKVYTYMHPVQFPRYQPGAMVDVRFDPKDPSDVVLVPP
jgi:hypothetical protein